jgi:hypothetical protein
MLNQLFPLLECHLDGLILLVFIHVLLRLYLAGVLFSKNRFNGLRLKVVDSKHFWEVALVKAVLADQVSICQFFQHILQRVLLSKCL